MTVWTRLERALESVLFGSRWLLAPFYIGLVASLLVLLARFALSLAELVRHVPGGSEDDLIVSVLNLVDLSLIANLVLIVMFSGYENFVSRMHSEDHPDRPDWIAHTGFAELKLKLMTSIVAIAAIHVLEDFLSAPGLPTRDLAWRAGLLLLFVVSGVLLALMDRVSKRPPSGGH